MLEKIKDFADRAHGNQQRKYSPERYIAHPVRVMEMCRKYTNELPILAAALLHDVLEDTPVAKEKLLPFLQTVMTEEEAKKTTQLVVELTDVYTKAAHPRWNRKKRKQKEAERIQKTSGESQTIRYADIIDNCQGNIEHDPEFARVFLCECQGLLKLIKSGNEALYKEAVETVDHALQQVLQA